MVTEPIGTELPDGARFIGAELGSSPNWAPGAAPTHGPERLRRVQPVSPHCPTYRLTGEESASPRGRIAAMRAVHEGRAATDETFARFMDLCLVCRACEDVCPSHVPFGRMMEAARTQIEPKRSAAARFLRWLGLDVVLPSPRLTTIAARLTPWLGRSSLADPRTDPIRWGVARPGSPVTAASGEVRGTVALLSGCVQDRWFRRSNSPRSGSSRGTAGACTCRATRRAAAPWPRTTAASRRRKARSAQRSRVRGRGSRDRERGGVRRPHDLVRRARRRRGTAGSGRGRVPLRRRPPRRTRLVATTDALPTTTHATRCASRGSSVSHERCSGR